MKTLQENCNAPGGILTVIVGHATSKSNFLLVLLVGIYLAAALRGVAQPTLCPNPPTSYTIDFQAGYTLFANQLDVGGNPANNTLNNLLPNALTGSTIFKWTGTNFASSTKVGANWIPNNTLNPGEAAFLHVAQPLSVTFNGTPRSTETPVTITPGDYYVISRQKGCPATYDDIVGSPPVNGIALYKWKGPLGTGYQTVESGDYQVYYYVNNAWSPFTPTVNVGEAVIIGPEQETIEGMAFENSGDCISPGLGGLSNWRIILSDTSSGSHIRDTFTSEDGAYRFIVTPGTYTVRQIPACSWTTTCPAPSGTYTVTVNTGDHSIGNDFGGEHPAIFIPDLSVQVYATVPPHNGEPKRTPCCGDTMSYQIFYRNQCGTASAGATVVLILSDPVSFASADTVPSNVSTDFKIVTWTLGALATGANGQIDVTVNLDALGSTCSHSPPTLVAASVIINPATVGADHNYANNTAIHTTFTKCAYDPNEKEVTPKGCGPAGLVKGDQLLSYVVHFQNLGSGPAFDVVVHDRLDDDLDLSTLEIIGASHNNVFEINGREMVWTFPNIYLPAAIDNEPGSHGFFSYRVKPLPGLAEGTVITNRAGIYFDNNPPVLTPVTTNTITLNADPLPSASFIVTPEQGSAGHTNDFTYTGGTAGASFLWNFGSDAVPLTSTDMNPSGVVFATDGLKNVTLQVTLAGCEAELATYLVSVGQPRLNVGLSGDQVCLSWEGGGYSLQETVALNVPISWQTIQPPIMLVGSARLVCLGVTNIFRCYRLTDQP